LFGFFQVILLGDQEARIHLLPDSWVPY
jgi:hypothetical protein